MRSKAALVLVVAMVTLGACSRGVTEIHGYACGADADQPAAPGAGGAGGSVDDDAGQDLAIGGSGGGAAGAGGTDDAGAAGGSGGSGAGGAIADAGSGGAAGTGGAAGGAGGVADAGAGGAAGSGGTPDAGPPCTAVYPLHVSANGRILLTPCGVPFQIHGDQEWTLFVTATTAEATQALENRRLKGVNTVMVMGISRFAPGADGANRAGDRPFLSNPSDGQPDVTRPNEPYWAHVDEILAIAASKGIQVAMAAAYYGIDGDNTAEGWYLYFQHYSDGVARGTLYGNFIGARYRNAQNIIWVAAGDYNPPNHAITNAIQNAIRAQESGGQVHLQTAHCGRNNSAAACFGAEPWLTLNASYTSFVTYTSVLAEYHRSPVRPVFLEDAEYENEHSSTRQQLRAQSYWALSSGAVGQHFGNNPVWHLALTGSQVPSAPYTWQVGLDADGSQDQTRVRALQVSLRWSEMVPDDAHLLVTGGLGSGSSFATATATPDGRQAWAYCPNTHTLVVNMARMAGPTTARWYDPTTGSYQAIAGSPFANTGSRNFATPGTHAGGTSDWALVLEAGP